MEVLVGILLAIVVIIIVLALSDMVADEYVYYDGDTDWLETLFGPLSAKERSIIMPGMEEERRKSDDLHRCNAKR